MKYTVKVEGMTFDEVKWNVYAFGADAKRLQHKVNRARLSHTREKWQKKLDAALKYLRNNEQRLAMFPIEQAHDDYLRTEVE